MHISCAICPQNKGIEGILSLIELQALHSPDYECSSIENLGRHSAKYF